MNEKTENQLAAEQLGVSYGPKGATIPLRKPLSIDGANVGALSMREPTVDDQLAADKSSGSDVEKEVAMMANLCMVKPQDIRQLTMRDYKRAQAALAGFLD